MRTRAGIRRTVLLFAAGQILAGLATSAPAVPARGDELPGDEARVVEEVIVTGTRIERTERFEAAAHVVVIDEPAIDVLAQLNIADVLRSSPLNSFGSTNEWSGSEALSNATFNLRGLGSERTLVLLDGMRLPGSPNLGADSVNINLLPMAALQRVDILADGASAVYGSNAMAGVVNLVTHKRFEGVEFTARYGDRREDDGGDERLGILAGKSFDKGNVVLALEYSHRDPIFDIDRWYTAPRVEDMNGDGRIDLHTDTVGVNHNGRTWRLTDPNTGFYQIRPATDCPASGGFVGEIGIAATVPDMSVCAYAFGNVAANRAELKKTSAHFNGTYALSGHAEWYVRGMYARNDAFGRYAPSAALWPNPPIDHPHIPFDIGRMIADGSITEDYRLLGFYRWTNLGPRDDHTTDTQWDLAAGLKGRLRGDLRYDIYLQSGNYDSHSIRRYFLSYPGLDYVLANGLDPFSDEGTEAMRATPIQDNFTRQNKAYGHLQVPTGDPFGAGEAIALLGLEYADIDYRNQYDAMTEAGLIGGIAWFAKSSAGKREHLAVFGEYLLPLAGPSELNLAVRYDDYSDVGAETSASVGYILDFSERLALRARWGRGFKAPALSSMYGATHLVYFSPYDPVTGNSRPVEVYFGPNPDLEAEESESLSVGLNWEYAEGHVLDLAYYDVEITNLIDQPDYQGLLYADAYGAEWDPGATRVERVGGNVEAIYSFMINGDRLEARGIDLQLHSSFDTDWGLFDIHALFSHQLEYKVNAYFGGGFQDTAGFFLQPETRAQGTLAWTRGSHGVSLVLDYIGPHDEWQPFDIETGLLSSNPNELDSWTAFNIAYSYDWGQRGRFRLGANNLTSEDPILYGGKYEYGLQSLYDNIGAVYYLEYWYLID